VKKCQEFFLFNFDLVIKFAKNGTSSKQKQLKSICQSLRILRQRLKQSKNGKNAVKSGQFKASKYKSNRFL
jgi:hypothetical protein